MRRLAALLGMDRHVFYVLMTRCWVFVSGPVTVLLISARFTPALQGYYYTFASLLALQSFVDLAFSIVIIQFASHEWTHLGLDPDGSVTGDPAARARLASLGRLATRWYVAAGLVFIVGVGLGGHWFLAQKPEWTFPWRASWYALVAVTGGQLMLTPFTAVLEGCGQVASLYRFRTKAMVVASLGLWLAIDRGAGLWAMAVYNGLLLLSHAILLWRYRRFFAPWLRKRVGAPAISWHREMLPMQWRLAASGVVSYFAFSLYTPAMFWYHGAETAGRMGMTWQVLTAIQGAGLAWIIAAVPRFGGFIARGDFASLDRTFFHASGVSLGVVTSAAAGFWALLVIMRQTGFFLSDRFLDPLPTALFLVGIVFMHVSQCQSAYLRAHKREPLLFLSISSSLATGLLVVLLGRPFGPTGAAIAFLAVVALFSVPYETWLWLKLRRLWHAVDPPPAGVAE